jgi:hypothetical protein
VVSLLTRSGTPITVRETVATVPVGQSTVWEHLRQLAAAGFVLAEERGTWASHDDYENSILPSGYPAGAPPGSSRLRLRPLPRRPHRLAHPAAPDELTCAPTRSLQD